jgi:hypothetical protein
LLVARFCCNTVTFSKVFDDSLLSTYQSDILIIAEDSKATIFGGILTAKASGFTPFSMRETQ